MDTLMNDVYEASLDDLVERMPPLPGDPNAAMNSAISSAAAFKTSGDWTPRDQMQFVWKMAEKYYRKSNK